MNANDRRVEPARRNRPLDPQNDVVAGSSIVVPEVMIETDLRNAPLLE
jgi:hypothetical protein